MRRYLQSARILIQSVLAKSALYLFALLPLRLTHFISRGVGILTALLPNELRFASKHNIAICFPQLTTREQKRLLFKSLQETSKTLFESGSLWLWPGPRVLKLVRNVHGEDLVKKALDEGHGVIFAIPHLGSWEIIGLYCSSHYPTTSMYKPPRLKAMEQVIRRGRERLGSRLVPTDTTGVKALLSALKHGETICILPDQDPGIAQGEFAPFFNTQACSMTLLPKLIGKTNARVIFAYAKRLTHAKGFDIYFSEADEAIYSKDIKVAVKAMNQGIEACVRQLPEQYLWSYRRFKTRPEGEGNIYVKD
jgi:KDO2-lipid IV(A) lauroyltransferase